MSAEQDHGHVGGFRMYFIVWGALIALTGVTVGVSYIDLKNVSIMAALMIATVKVTLVTLYFMHVRFDKIVIPYMILVFIVTYAIYVGLTMSDYGFR